MKLLLDGIVCEVDLDIEGEEGSATVRLRAWAEAQGKRVYMPPVFKNLVLDINTDFTPNYFVWVPDFSHRQIVLFEATDTKFYDPILSVETLELTKILVQTGVLDPKSAQDELEDIVFPGFTDQVGKKYDFIGWMPIENGSRPVYLDEYRTFTEEQRTRMLYVGVDVAAAEDMVAAVTAELDEKGTVRLKSFTVENL